MRPARSSAAGAMRSRIKCVSSRSDEWSSGSIARCKRNRADDLDPYEAAERVLSELGL